MEAIAKGKFLRGSPQKARLVIDMIRGKNVAQALAILQFTNKRATENIEKCLRSAIANATFKAEQDNVAIDPDDLWVKTCFVDMGPHKNRRRVRPAPQGRAYREQRYYCHITIQLTSVQPVNTKLVGKTRKSALVAPATINSKNAKSKKNLVVKEAVTEETVLPSDSPKTLAEQEILIAPQVEAINESQGTVDTVETSSVAADETATDSEASIAQQTPAKNETESTSEEKKTD